MSEGAATMQSWPSFLISRWSPYPVGPAVGVMKTLMRNGRDRRSEKPVMGHIAVLGSPGCKLPRLPMTHASELDILHHFDDRLPAEIAQTLI